MYVALGVESKKKTDIEFNGLLDPSSTAEHPSHPRRNSHTTPPSQFSNPTVLSPSAPSLHHHSSPAAAAVPALKGCGGACSGVNILAAPKCITDAVSDSVGDSIMLGPSPSSWVLTSSLSAAVAAAAAWRREGRFVLVLDDGGEGETLGAKVHGAISCCSLRRAHSVSFCWWWLGAIQVSRTDGGQGAGMTWLARQDRGGDVHLHTDLRTSLRSCASCANRSKMGDAAVTGCCGCCAGALACT